MSDEVVKAKLPTLAEIVAAEGLTDREQSNALHVLLNQPPPANWIKVQDGVKHLPVDKVKFLLTKIFIDWYEEIQCVQTVANSVVVVVTLHFRNPITGRWSKMDGIGAAPINTKKGAGSMDWNQIVHDSVHKCAGAADSFALKNAAKKLGRIFGSELTVDDKISYDGLIDPEKFKDAKITEK
jgi:hypothetical protein